MDQLTKWVARISLMPGESFPVLPDFFHFTLVYNRGIAFGLFNQNPSILFILISMSLVLLAIIARQAYAEKSSRLGWWGMALILAGAIGNWIDRFRFQAVVDFLDFRVWPVFNLADTAITVGVGLYLLLLMRKT